MALFFNEDPNHFLFSRSAAGIDVGEKEIYDFIDRYKNTAVTDFMICLNARTAWYDSTYSSIFHTYDRLLEDGRDLSLYNRSLLDAIRLADSIYRKKKLPMISMWIDRLRGIGINPWISIRMNDIHDSDDRKSLLHSDLFLRHPEYLRGAHHRKYGMGYYDYAEDFMVPEVYADAMKRVTCSLEDFDAFGIELDWMREPFTVRIGREYEATPLLTGFMGEVKKLVAEKEKERGHKIKIAVRVPSSPEKALRMGFDVVDWAEKGYVDNVAVCPRWSSADNDMPLDLWKRILAHTGVTLAGGVEILYDCYNRRPGREYLMQDLYTAAGFAASIYAQGIDNVYLFNFMDSMNTDTDSWELLFSDTKYYAELLGIMGDKERCYSSTRRCIHTNEDISAVGTQTRGMLPFFTSGESTEFASFRFPVGRIGEGKKIVFILGTNKCDLSEVNFAVFCNSVPCRFYGKNRFIPAYKDKNDYYFFGIDEKIKWPEVIMIEVKAAFTEFTIHWAEIDIE